MNQNKLLSLALNKKISNKKILQIESDIFNHELKMQLIEHIKKSIIDNDAFDIPLVITELVKVSAHNTDELLKWIGDLRKEEADSKLFDTYLENAREEGLKARLLSLVNTLNNTASSMTSDEILARTMYITDQGTDRISKMLSDSILHHIPQIIAGDDIIKIPGFIEKVQGGLTLGEISAWGGRPGDGKTNLLVNIVDLLAKLYPDMRILIISREMSALQLEKRFILLNADGQLTYPDLRTGKPLEGEKKNIAEHISQQVAEIYKNVIIEDGIEDIDGSVAAILKHRPTLILDDFIQLATSSKYSEEKVRYMINSALKTYKWLSKKLKAHVINFSQLNREIEKRLDQTPTMSDFNESGLIEQLCELAIVMRNEKEGFHTHYVLKSRHGKKNNKYNIPYFPEQCKIELTTEVE